MPADFAVAQALGWSERETAGAVIGKQPKQTINHGVSPMSAFIIDSSVASAPADFRPVMDAG